MATTSVPAAGSLSLLLDLLSPSLRRPDPCVQFASLCERFLRSDDVTPTYLSDQGCIDARQSRSQADESRTGNPPFRFRSAV